MVSSNLKGHAYLVKLNLIYVPIYFRKRRKMGKQPYISYKQTKLYLNWFMGTNYNVNKVHVVGNYLIKTEIV